MQFLECADSNCESTWVGLTPDKNVSAGGSSFYVNCKGVIYVNDCEKATFLPEIKRGSKVVFTCNSISTDKVRVDLDLSEKRVTYDWNVSYERGFYFFAKFGSSKWKIAIE